MNPNNPQNSAPKNLDNNVVALMRAIRTQESGGKYDLKGQSGEYGAYQYTQPTWRSNAKKYLGDENASLSKENQNFVTYHALEDMKKQGYNPAQIASIWNSGDPNWEGKVGVNKYGVKYDTPSYVKIVSKNFQDEANKLKQQSPNGIQLGNNTAYAQGEQAPQEEKKTVGGFAGNVLKSGGKLLGGTVNALIHPFKTLGTLGKLGAGAISNVGEGLGLGGGNTKSNQMVDQLVQSYKQRYGKDLGKTLYEDPVGVLADLSVLIGGAAGVAGKVGEVGKIGSLSEAASTAGKFASAIDPLQAAGRGLSKIGATPGNLLNKTGDLASQALGFSTGKGAPVVKQVFNAGREGSEAATGAMRGAVNEGDILSKVDQGVSGLRAKQSEALNDLNLKGMNHSLDVSPVFKELDTQLKNFKVDLDSEGNLDFSSSPIRFDAKAKTDIQTIYDEMAKFGKKAGDRTPAGVDSLKRAFASLYTENKEARAFIEAMRKKTRQVLSDVPGYDKYAQTYGDIADILSEIRRELSTGATESTQWKKLASALKGANNEQRVNIIKTLEEAGGGDILNSIAGFNMKNFIDRGNTPTFLGGGLTLGGLSNPAVFAGLPFLSPRLVGEGANLLGKGIGKLERFKLPDNAAMRAAKAAGKQIYGKGNLTRNAQLVENLKDKGDQP